MSGDVYGDPNKANVASGNGMGNMPVYPPASIPVTHGWTEALQSIRLSALKDGNVDCGDKDEWLAYSDRSLRWITVSAVNVQKIH